MRRSFWRVPSALQDDDEKGSEPSFKTSVRISLSRLQHPAGRRPSRTNNLYFGHRTERREELPLLCRFLDAVGVKPVRALGRPASKKRQGAKSRPSGPAAGSRALWGF